MGRRPLEKEIETALVKMLRFQPWVKGVWRQVSLPIGIADVVVLTEVNKSNHLMVFELKRRAVDEKAFTQLVGYMSQLVHFVKGQLAEISDPQWDYEPIATMDIAWGVLVGDGANDMTARAIAHTPNIEHWNYHVVEGEIVFDPQETTAWFGYKPMERPGELTEAIMNVAISFRNIAHARWHKVYYAGRKEMLSFAEDRERWLEELTNNDNDEADEAWGVDW